MKRHSTFFEECEEAVARFVERTLVRPSVQGSVFFRSMRAELPEQLVYGLLAQCMELSLDHQLIERLAGVCMLGTQLVDHVPVTLLEMREQISLLAIDVRTQTSVHLAKHIEDCREIRSLDRVG